MYSLIAIFILLLLASHSELTVVLIHLFKFMGWLNIVKSCVRWGRIEKYDNHGIQRLSRANHATTWQVCLGFLRVSDPSNKVDHTMIKRGRKLCAFLFGATLEQIKPLSEANLRLQFVKKPVYVLTWFQVPPIWGPMTPSMRMVLGPRARWAVTSSQPPAPHSPSSLTLSLSHQSWSGSGTTLTSTWQLWQPSGGSSWPMTSATHCLFQDMKK